MTEKLSLPHEDDDNDQILLRPMAFFKEDIVDQEYEKLVPLDKEAYPVLNGDKRRLMQVLLNLVKNALKFTTQGSISVAFAYDCKKCLLVGHVRDTGVGIEKEDQSKLFTRFGKLLRSAEMNHEGIGLGLTIVKQIVDQCDG